MPCRVGSPALARLFFLFAALAPCALHAAEPTAAELMAAIQQLRQVVQDQQKQLDDLRKELSGRPAVAAPTAVTPAPLVAAAAPPPKPEAPSAGPTLAGIRLGGDLRLRFDLQARSGNAVAGPLQNARERYRFRLNMDRDLFTVAGGRSLVRIHAQMATAPLSNPLTMDTDFSGVVDRAALSLSEAWVDLAPTRNITFRVGRTTEIFADNLQYMFDDDVRFNGFHQSYRFWSKGHTFLEARAGQYILTNPNIPVVPAGSPFLAAGYRQGQRVPSTAMFDQGVVLGSQLSHRWSMEATGNYLVVREPNQIQMASTTAGFPLLTSPALGTVLTGPLPETGNATTTAGGSIYYASDFKVLRGAFTATRTGAKLGSHEMPLRLFMQGSRNGGASMARSGFQVGATVGQSARRGDLLLQYAYFYKPANGFVSQLTDDDVGTGSGVNIRVHALRFDLGLARFMAWENRLYIQDQIARTNAAAGFFVPLEKGANTTLRLQSQFLFRF